MYLTVTDAAKKMGIHRTYMHKLINDGLINTTIIAHRRFVIEDHTFKNMRSERKKLPK
jgi:excisionase family DNA binding protein